MAAVWQRKAQAVVGQEVHFQGRVNTRQFGIGNKMQAKTQASMSKPCASTRMKARVNAATAA
jgi:hypothetical protein